MKPVLAGRLPDPCLLHIIRGVVGEIGAQGSYPDFVPRGRRVDSGR